MSSRDAVRQIGGDGFEGAAAELHGRIEDRTARVAVIGLGYVGLPMVRAFHSAGFEVLGYDTDASKVTALERGENYLKHLGEDLARELAASDSFRPTSDLADLADADAFVLCVPTPLGEHREPDLSFVLDSTRALTDLLRPGQLVVLTSTTYPGTTRDEVRPILESTGLAVGEDLFLAFSPEREDPGRQGLTTATIPRLVGGVDPASGDLAYALFSSAVAQVHLVGSAEVAEAAKLLENIYRAVNIALVNELKILLTAMDVDVWEVIGAAATKPFGFHAFFPGPGLGGHCIPIDPFYLTWKAKEVGLHTRFIELAGEINTAMPAYVVQRVVGALNDDKKPLNGSKVLVLGVAYKKNVEDMRETPAAEIIERLIEGGAEVVYHDPHVSSFPGIRHHRGIDLHSVALDRERLAGSDCVLVITDHDRIDWHFVAQHAPLVVDTRRTVAGLETTRARVVSA